MEVEDTDELSKAWSENPELIRDFMEVHPHYEQLCSEVAYILTKCLKGRGVEFSAITRRAKSLRSFTEKLKNYGCPEDITDIAGVRVVYLYKADRYKIEELIEREFEVVEKVDKVDEQQDDRFGYGALHYLIHLGPKSSGARYDDLKGLVCEVQVRTVLQDAWAIVAHHISYKQESDIPKVLRRKLNSLSGLFETADDQFDQVRAERRQYQETVRSVGKKQSDFLDQEINLDTFTEFLRWKFQNLDLGSAGHLAMVLSRTSNLGYKRLSELNSILDRTEKARDAARKQRGPIPAPGEVATAMAFLNPAYRAKLNKNSAALIEKYEHLVS